MARPDASLAPMPDFREERRLGLHEGRRVVGLDESGRGPLAGPVVAACVYIEGGRLPRRLKRIIDDCKLVEPAERRSIYEVLQGEAVCTVGLCSVEEIDSLNILRASLLAMSRACEALGWVPDHALVDGNQPPNLHCDSTMIVGADGLCLSVAAASIVAKVTRDRIMDGLAQSHPGYGWERNRGYSTAEHLRALLDLGVTPQHRRSFAPVRDRLALSA